MKVANPDFFKSSDPDKLPRLDTSSEAQQAQAVLHSAEKARPAEPQQVRVRPVIGKAAVHLAQDTVKTLAEYHHNEEAKMADRIVKTTVRDLFSVAVVGEFNRGKSTFLNRLLGRELLPVGNMPTTAMLTRIRYHSAEQMVYFDESGKKRKVLPLKPSSWEGLTAENLGEEDPKGTVYLGVKSDLLCENNLELIDTPGAGDLEQERAQQISDALLGSDGAIIAVNATAPLSESEQLFIEQRLIARRTPRLMLILNRMDQIPLKQRADVVSFVQSKLDLKKWDIPVYIPYEIDMPNKKFDDIIGMDAVRKELLSWIFSADRAELAQTWMMAALQGLVKKVQSSLREQTILLQANETERQHLIEQKKKKLNDTALVWGNLKMGMEERCKNCQKLLETKKGEYINTIIDRLQFEAGHSGDPEKWWTEDYSYRLKIELTSAASGLNSVTTQRISSDAKWFSYTIEQRFKENVLYNVETVASKDAFLDAREDRTVVLDNLTQKRNIVRIATTAVSIAGAAVLNLAGLAPFVLIATMGVGTGSAIISEKVFKGKIETQRQALKDAIAQNIPEIFNNAAKQSEQKITEMYEDLIRSATQQEKLWMTEQENAIEKSQQPADPQRVAAIEEETAVLSRLSEKIGVYLDY